MENSVSISDKDRAPSRPEEREELVRILFPDVDSTPTIAALEAKYPLRQLPDGAKVVRVAPSPTGFVHIGTVFISVINRLLASQSQGRFILRIEDTDDKREVAGGTAQIIRTLDMFSLHPDEGFVIQDGEVIETGAYGPYKQSERRSTYHAFAIELVRQGLAYPCFCSAEELKELDAQQTAVKARPGYYGRWAKWRDAPLSRVKDAVGSGTPFVIRFRSWGDGVERMVWRDGIKGPVSAPTNLIDTVIIKSDGGSLYNFAHIIDDYLMRVTDVVRGDEYVSSMPMYMQLYQALGVAVPRLYHIGPLCKLETREETDPETGEVRVVESRRKISKRKDPDANVDHFREHGYPAPAVLDYLMNIANSNFEDWRKEHPLDPLLSFALSPDRFSTSGAVFDLTKLHDVSRETISRFSTETIYEQGLEWARGFDQDLAALMERYPEFTKASIAIERETAKGAKRITLWTDLRPQLFWFYDEEFSVLKEFPFPENLSADVRKQVLEAFLQTYDPADDNTVWFNKCKDIAATLGFAAAMKDFKQNPEKYLGNIADFTMVIRVGVSGRRETPDLHSVLKVLGKERVQDRLRTHT